jgi:hypothetical protein
LRFTIARQGRREVDNHHDEVKVLAPLQNVVWVTGFRVCGLGFRVCGFLGNWVSGLGFMFEVFGFRFAYLYVKLQVYA